ncbi:hypothetical protein ACYCHN_22780, partial [Klebsiella pneumoniae]
RIDFFLLFKTGNLKGIHFTPLVKTSNSAESQKILIHSDYLNNEIAIRTNRFNFLVPFSPYTKEIIISK